MKTIRSGKLGDVKLARFKRTTCEPAWLNNYWSADIIGGPMFDLHIHDAHFIRLLFGNPTSVSASGRLRRGLPEFWTTRFHFAGRKIAVHATSGIVDEPRISFCHGFHIGASTRTCKFEFEVLDTKPHYVEEPQIIASDGRVRRPKLSGGDPLAAFVSELREALDCVRKGRSSEVLAPEFALDAVRICHAEAKSLERERSVRL